VVKQVVSAAEFIAKREQETNVKARLTSPAEGKTWVMDVQSRTYYSDNPTVIFVLERLAGGWISGNNVMYRVRYHRLIDGRWHNPNLAPTFSKKEHDMLYAKATAEGTLL